MPDSRRRYIAIGINLLVFVLEVWAIWHGILKHGIAGNFVYYTECSNLLGGVACLACAIAEIRQLQSEKPIGKGLRILKYLSSCCLMMTLMVVVCILTPMLESAGYPGVYMMFLEGAKPVTHLGAPLLVTVSYALFEHNRMMSLKESLIGIVPTLIYAAVAYPCNIAELWDGPYPFLQVLDMPVWVSVLWFIALLLFAFALCQIPRVFGNVIIKQKKMQS